MREIGAPGGRAPGAFRPPAAPAAWPSDVSHPPSSPVFTGPRPLVFAHRGGAALRPENTMAAFEHGAACGADGFELDVRLARDGELVVIHDDTLDRTTNASGPVSSMTSDELARVDAAAQFRITDGAPFKGLGIGVPRYRDVLRLFPDAVLVVELKGSDPAVGRAAAAVTREEGALGRVCLGGFTDAVVQAARAEAAQAVTSAATEETRKALYRAWIGLSPRAPAYAGFQVPERYGPTVLVTKRFVRVMRRAGLFVHVWTVNTERDITRLLDWGVRGVITDVPPLAVPTVRTWYAAQPTTRERRPDAR